MPALMSPQAIGTVTTTTSLDHLASEDSLRDFQTSDRTDWRYDLGSGTLIPTERVQIDHHVIDTTMVRTFDTTVQTETESTQTVDGRNQTYENSLWGRNRETVQSGRNSIRTATSTTPLEGAAIGVATLVVTGTSDVSYRNIETLQHTVGNSSLETVGPSYYRLETGTGDGQWTTFDEVRTTHHPDGTGDARYFGNRGVSGPGWTETWYEESNGEVVENESYHMPVAYHDDQPNSYDVTIPHDSPESGEIPTPYHEPPALQPTTPTGGAMGPGGISAPEDPSEVDGLRNQVADDASMAYETNAVNDQAIVELTQTTGSLGHPEAPNSPASEYSLQGAATMAGYAGSQSSLPNSANPAAIAAGATGDATDVSRDRSLIAVGNIPHFLSGMAYGFGDGAVGLVDGFKTAVRGVGQYGYFVWVHWAYGMDAAAGTSAGQND